MGIIDPGRIPKEALDVLDRLTAAGYAACLVGGCVRDLASGRDPKDYDVATSAPVAEVAALFPRTVPTGLRHGTVTVLAGALAVEVTTFRSEGAYRDHRRPSEVVFHDDRALDLARRDFTCNAMAWTPEEGLVDLFGGRDDLRAGVLRTVGDPEDRFREDALRMLRAVRFCCALDLAPVGELVRACARNAGLLSHVSAERIAGECTRIFLSTHPARLAGFDGSGVLEAAFGRVLPLRGETAGLAYGAYLASALERFGPSAEAGYALLLLHAAASGGLDARDAMASKQRLMAGHRLSARISGGAAALAFVAASPTGAPGEEETALRRTAARLARVAGLDGATARLRLRDGVRLLHALPTGNAAPGLADAAASIARRADPVTSDELALSGSDLVALGHSAGPSLGRLRQRLLEAVIEDPRRNRREALQALLEGMV